MKKQFPPAFNWGVTTTAVQIEGGQGPETGRGPGMWSAFAAEEGNTYNGDGPKHAARSYEYLDRDLVAVQRLGVKTYNFTACWPRLLPEGSGRINQQGIDYYHRLIDGLLARDVRPELSLFDWDLPLAYAERGGWERRDLTERFGEYLDLLIREYGDRVTHWMTFNEISTQALNGYLKGNHAPGRQSLQGYLRAYHHLLLAHGQSVERLRAAGDYSISLVDNLLPYYPATVTDADRDAAAHQWEDLAYYPLDAVFKGKLRNSFRERYEAKGLRFDHVREGDLRTISQPIDRFGVNYFTSFNVSHDPDDPRGIAVSAAPGTQSPFGWTIDPQGLLEALRMLRRDYTHELPLFIGECGVGQVDYPDPNGEVIDRGRIDYLRQHLEKVHTAIAEGIPVEGFFVWSLMDNFEWQEGYRKRFGLFYTRYDRPAEYTIKASGQWYAEVCKTAVLA